MKKKIAVIAFTAVCLLGAVKFQKSMADSTYKYIYLAPSGCTACGPGTGQHCDPATFHGVCQ